MPTEEPRAVPLKDGPGRPSAAFVRTILVVVLIAGCTAMTVQILRTSDGSHRRRSISPPPQVNRFSSRYLNSKRIPGLRPEDLLQTFKNLGLKPAGFGIAGGPHNYHDRIRFGPAGNPNAAPLMHIWHLYASEPEVTAWVDVYGVQNDAVHLVVIQVANNNSPRFEVDAHRRFREIGLFDFKGADITNARKWLVAQAARPGKTEIGSVTYEILSDLRYFSAEKRMLVIEGADFTSATP